MQDFDKLVRSMMENGREEVPAGLWDAVQSQLPAPVSAPVATKNDRKAVILMWTRRAGVAIAAAAAITMGIVFSGRQQTADQIEIVSGRSMVADVEQEQTISVKDVTSEFVPDAVPSSAEAIYSTDNSSATDSSRRKPKVVESAESSPKKQKVSGLKVVEEAVAEKKVVEEAVSESKAVESTQEQKVAEKETAQKNASSQKILDDMAFEDAFAASRAPRKTALYLSGNASSNTNPVGKGGRGPMRVPVATPTTTGITETGESTFMIPVSIGAGVKFPFADKLSIGLGVNATYLSRTYAGTYREFSEGGELLRSETYSDIRNSQFYVGIPVNMYFSIVNNHFVDFYVYGGGSAEKCVYNNNIMRGPEGNTYFKDRTGGLQYSAGVGLGCEFMVANHLGIYIDPSARYYFKGKNSPKSVRTQQPFMAGIELGLRVKL